MESVHVGAALVCVLFLGCAARGPGAPPSPAPAQQTRSADEICVAAELARKPEPAVRALLAGGDAASRSRAALAAGRLADAAAAPALAALLDDAQAGGAAAWALGRIEGGEAALVACLGRACPAAAASARALGAPGRSPAAIAALAAALDARRAGAGGIANPGRAAAAEQGRASAAASPPREPAAAAPALGSAAEADATAASAALALGILARVGGKGADAAVAQAARPALLAALASPDAELRRGAAYALGRIARGEAASGQAALASALRDANDEVRALAARAWGKQGLAASALAPSLEDADWRVRVEASLALANAEGPAPVIAAALPAAIAALKGAGPGAAREAHPLVALLGVAGPLGRDALPRPESLQAATGAATVAVRCAAALARDRAAVSVDETPHCGAGLEPEWRGRLRAGALACELASGAHGTPALVERARAALHDSDARVRSGAATECGAPLAQDLRALLADPDPYVVADAAAALAKAPETAAAAIRDAAQAVARLGAARERHAGDPSSDALAALAQLLAAAGKPHAAEALPALLSLAGADSTLVHQSLLDALRSLAAPLPQTAAPRLQLPAEATPGLPGAGLAVRTLLLRTTAGELVIDLHTAPGEAPLTAAAVLALARRGFYDGLGFHRVVPDFVAQGGDPRGDGDGGPGWTLPDEHTPLFFRRGTLGIATSGPDTGGSQLFLCHSPQPHLDGRYTIAGELRSGGEVLDALQVGDAISSAAVQ